MSLFTSVTLLITEIKLNSNKVIDNLEPINSFWNPCIGVPRGNPGGFDTNVANILACTTSTEKLITDFLKKTEENPGQFLTVQRNFVTGIRGILNDRRMIAIATNDLSRADGDEYKSYGKLADRLIKKFKKHISTLDNAEQELRMKMANVKNSKATIDKFQPILSVTNEIRKNLSNVGAIVYPMQRTVVKVNAQKLNSQFAAIQENLEKFENFRSDFEQFMSNNTRVPPILFESLSRLQIDLAELMNNTDFIAVCTHLPQAVEDKNYGEKVRKFNEHFAKVTGDTEKELHQIVLDNVKKPTYPSF